MSKGWRSGVNWMRLKLRLVISETVRTAKVFATPGTPSRRRWPRVRSAMRMLSPISFWPTITRWNCSR
jgi:hypothetical protein